MFSKAKRFEDKPVGCGASVIYNPKDGKKAIGGVIPKVDRFTEARNVNCAKSDTESVCSDKSAPIFRTPKSIKRVRAPRRKSESDETCDDFQRLIETRNNEEELKEFEKKIHALRDVAEKEISSYKLEIETLKKLIDSDNVKISDFSDRIETLTNDSENKKRDYEEKIDRLQEEIDRINEEKLKFSLTLKATHRSVEVLSARLRNSDEDVAKFKSELDEALRSNEAYETEISILKKDLLNLRKEYDNVLLSIVESKSALDKNHQEILNENARLAESLIDMENDMKINIDMLKNDLFTDVEEFKKHAQKLIIKFRKETDDEHDRFIEVKSRCDEAFTKMAECERLLTFAENQLEAKDQELNEVITENIKLSGTLTAVEQEKRELELLLSEFVHLAKEKDFKIRDNIKQIEKYEKNISDAEDRIKKLTQFLEATEFIVKEKDADIFKLQGDIVELSSEIESLNAMNEEKTLNYEQMLKTLTKENDDYQQECERLNRELSKVTMENDEGKATTMQLQQSIKNKDHKIEELNTKVADAEIHFATCNSDILKKHCKTLEIELQEMTDKYMDLLGHHNTKQKIKHVVDLKTQNKILKEENENLKFTIEAQNAKIETLKKDVTEFMSDVKAYSTNKFLDLSPSGKENIRTSLTPKKIKSPKKKSERQLTPLKESNR